MRQGLAWLFPSLSPVWRQREGICLQNCPHRSAVCFSNPYIGAAISSGTVSFEDPLGQNRDHTSHWKCEGHAVIRELYQLHIGFQMKLSWCVINSGSLRNWPYLCSSAGVLLLIIPAFIFQDMKKQWPKLLFPTCFNPNILQHSFRTFCMKSTTLPTLV